MNALRLKVKIGDRIISAETGKMYIIEEIERTEYKCRDEGNGSTWLLKSMVTDRRFFKD